MPLLAAFATPGNLAGDPDPAAWSKTVADTVGVFADAPRFFNPLAAEDPQGQARTHSVVWPAFPGELAQAGGGDEARWQAADQRDAQDEYCEWVVQRREDGKIVSVTFTTETPEYFEHLLDTDPEHFNALYQELTGSQPAEDELRLPDGTYNRANGANRAPGKIAHLSETSNTLGAAVRLAAEATVLRNSAGKPVTEKKALVDCGDLGGVLRNSDPQIADAVNGLVRDGRSVSLADPPGLYLDEFLAGGLRTPDGKDAGDFWQPANRGDDRHVMRATFTVPEELGYTVSDITTADGQPIRFGSQLAERVRVRLEAISLPSDAEPVTKPCEGEDA